MMATIARIFAALTLAAGGTLGLAGHAAAQYDNSCMTQSECDMKADLRDTVARTAEFQRNVKNQEDAHAAAMQARNEARARANGNRDQKLEVILQRRHEAYARAQH